LLSQLLLASSIVVASYQDVKERAVSDFVWIPALVGVALVLVFSPLLEFTLLKIALVGGLAFAFTWYGALGEADLIAFVVITSDPAPFSIVFSLGAAALVITAHVIYLYWAGYAGKSLQIPVEQFEREQKWIPKAVILNGVRTELGKNVNKAREEAISKASQGTMIEVSYGVPDVAYLGTGYIVFLAYLIIFNWGFFLSLP